MENPNPFQQTEIWWGLSQVLAATARGFVKKEPAVAAVLMTFAGVLEDPNPYSFLQLYNFCEELAKTRVEALSHETLE